ncbi:MAG: autotransporter-associated beta strand repeat-containing protein [Kiritimatiellae bacterium]|nr:autotransporter-associated beta strand repeat-containing protein [Kiritimatiellia bacterium]
MKNMFYVLCSVTFAVSSFAADGQWSSISNGDWSNAANWSGGVVAEGSTHTATFNAAGTSAVTVNNDLAALALGNIVLGGGGFILTGNGLLMDAGGAMQVLASDHALALPITLQGDLNYTVGSGLSLVQSGVLAGDGGISLDGGILTLAAAANSYTGKTVFTKGTLKFSDPAQLGSSNDNEGNLALGDGTLHYTGSGAVMSRGLTIDAAPLTFNKASVIRVDGDLEISGKFNALSGAFIKTGPGALHLSYPGDHQLCKALQGVAENTTLTYDVNGSVGSAGFAAFTLEQGSMLVSGADQIARFDADAYVGTRSAYSPELTISNATVYSTGSWWSIGRGTGTTVDPKYPAMKLLDGAYMNVQGSGFVMGNAQGNNEYLCYPSLLVDNSHLKVNNASYISENSNAHPTIVITNNGHYESSSGTLDRGLELSKSGGNTSMTITDNSILSAYYMAVRQNADLVVEHVSEARLHLSHSYMANQLSGDVFFDNATLRPLNQLLAPNWFLGMNVLNVRSGNMTIDVEKYAFLDPVLIEDPADRGGKVTKVGSGGLALRMPAADVDLQAGSLAFPCDDPLVRSKSVGTITAAAGTYLEASGQRALAGFSVPAATTLNMLPHSLTQFSSLWRLNGTAAWRSDGSLQLCDNAGGTGTAYLTVKQRMSGSWKAEFYYSGYSTFSNPADGVSFILHNDTRGISVMGGGANFMGYAHNTVESGVGIKNSVAVGIDVYNKYLRLGVNGVWVDAVKFPDGTPHLTLLAGAVKCTCEYNGSSTLDVKLSHPGFGFFAKTFNVDVAQALGAETSYVGFGVGTGGSRGQHLISSLSLFKSDDAESPDYCVVGGVATLGAGQSLTVNLEASPEQSGYVMDALTYADQSLIEINSGKVDRTPPELSLVEQSDWRLMGHANWLSDGRLATSTNIIDGRGGAYCYNSYDLLSRSWQLSFSLDLGKRSGTAADALQLVLMRENPDLLGSYSPPGSACRFEWRYYNEPQHQSSLKIYTNNVVSVAVPNLLPVNMQVDQSADITVSYDKPGDTVTLKIESGNGSYTHVITNFNLPKALYNSAAYVGFHGVVGGAFAENIVGDLALTYTDAAGGESSGESHYLAFNELTGSGTLVKTGSGALSLSGAIDAVSSNASVEIRDGAILLSKRALESATLGGGSVRNNWITGSLGKWGKDGSFQVCPAQGGARSNAHYGYRVCVSRAWTIEYDFFMDKKSGSPADAYSLFVHNDPRGVMALGGGTGSAGYAGSEVERIRNSVAVRWYFYPSNAAANTSELALNGAFIQSTRQSFDPIRLASGVTHTKISYDPAAQTLQSILSNGANVVTNTFKGVNIAAQVGGDFAWLGFGGGTGGAYCDMCVNNLSMSYQQELPDPTAERAYLAELIVPNGVAAPVYLHKPLQQALKYTLGAVALGSDATLKVGYAPGSNRTQPATLVAKELNLGNMSTVAVEKDAICMLETVTGGSLRKSGAGTLTFASGAQPDYTGSTVMEAGTLLLSEACLPEDTALAVTNGATLSLQFAGKQYVDTLTIEGVQYPGGLYTAGNTTWVKGAGILVVRNPASGSVFIVR